MQQLPPLADSSLLREFLWLNDWLRQWHCDVLAVIGIGAQLIQWQLQWLSLWRRNSIVKEIMREKGKKNTLKYDIFLIVDGGSLFPPNNNN